MSRVHAVVVALVFTAASAPARADAPLASPKGLAVATKLASASPMQAGAPISLTAALVNRGAAAQTVVKTGDGTESGWREPHVFVTGEEERGGAWVPVDPEMLGRCGLMGGNWKADAVVLRPGARLDLGDVGASSGLLLDGPGRARLVVHYVYTAGTGAALRDRGAPAGALGKVPPFEVRSAPVIVEVVRPVDVTLTLKTRVVKAGASVDLASLADVALVNRSGAPEDVVTPFGSGTVRFEMQAAPGAPTFADVTTEPDPPSSPDTVTLASGATRPLHVGGSYRAAAPGNVQIRAIYTEMRKGQTYRRLRSSWVGLTVIP